MRGKYWNETLPAKNQQPDAGTPGNLSRVYFLFSEKYMQKIKAQTESKWNAVNNVTYISEPKNTHLMKNRQGKTIATSGKEILMPITKTLISDQSRSTSRSYAHVDYNNRPQTS